MRGAVTTGFVIARPAQRARKGAWASEFVTIGLSIAAHAAVASAFLVQPPNQTGNIKTPSQAISVELIATDVIDAVDVGDTDLATVSSAAAAGSAISEVQPVEAAEIEPRDVSDAANAADVEETRATDDLVVITGQSAAEIPVNRTRTPPKKVAARPPPAQKSTKEKPKRQLQKANRQRDTKKASQNKSDRNASSGARVSNAKAGAKARLSASRGDIAGYAARVRARVAQRRPGGNGARGTVVVSFSISASGSVSSVQIRSSSGNRRLDSGALSAVRGAGPFPPTPDRRRLSFSVPFHYH